MNTSSWSDLHHDGPCETPCDLYTYLPPDDCGLSSQNRRLQPRLQFSRMYVSTYVNDTNFLLLHVCGFPFLLGMFPKQDINIELNKDVTMFCSINKTHLSGKDYSWKNLSFLIDNNTAALPWMVEKVNETSIQLFLNRTTLAPHDYFRVTCTLNNIGICTRFLYVGCKQDIYNQHQLIFNS